MEPNPTAQAQPFTAFTPKEGLFRDEQGTVFYRTPEGKNLAFNPTTLLSDEERRGLGNFGAQMQEGIRRLKDQYGFDVMSLEVKNIGDLVDERGVRLGSFAQTDDINQFLSAQPATFDERQMNTPEQLAGIPQELQQAQQATQQAQQNPPPTGQPQQNQVQQNQQQQDQQQQQDDRPASELTEEELNQRRFAAAGLTPEQIQQVQAGGAQQPIGEVNQQSYTVQAGDTLSGIARKFGVSTNDITGFRSGDPNLIFPGEQLTIGKQLPPPALPPVTTPQSGGQGTGQDDQAAAPQATPFESLLGQLGVSKDQFDNLFSSNPQKSVESLVADIMTATGLPDVKKQIEEVANQIEGLENERDEKIADVNDNPWISEALRNKKIVKVTEEYESRINNRTNKLKIFQDLADDARQQAQFAATLAVRQYNAERDFAQGQMEFIINAAEKAADNARQLSDQQFSQSLDIAELELAKKKYNLDVVKEARLGREGGASGAGGGTFTGEGGGNTTVDVPTYDEFWRGFLKTDKGKQIAAAYGGDNIGLSEKLREIYNQTVMQVNRGPDFSSTELKKLEQAGLLNADRQEQLDFLFGDEGDPTNFDNL